MKTAVIADLHANREAVQAVLDHAAAQGVQRYAFLGDFVGYGADPGWVVDLVREHVAGGAVVVRGNHDAAVAHGALHSMRAEARLVVEWTRAQLSASQLAFLAGLPLTREVGDVLYVHANAFDPPGWDYVQSRAEALRSLHATHQRITFCGHIHEPRLYHLVPTGEVGDIVPAPGEAIALRGPRRWLVIPGSAGQPRDGDPAACYAIFEPATSALTCWRVPYDHAAAAAKIRAAGLPAALASRLADGY